MGPHEEPPLRPPLLFIGSSTEGLEVAREIRTNLEKQSGLITRLWDDGIFSLSTYVADQMIATAATFDFAVLVFSPDDVVLSRDIQNTAPRDNIVFELGLFAGQLGRERTFAVVHGPDKPKLPSDFAGVTHATYKREPDEAGNLKPKVGPACDEIIKAVKHLGRLRHPDLEKTLYSIVINHRHAFKIEDPLFQQKLNRWCAWEKEDSEKWGQGLLRVSDDFPEVLKALCESAKGNIFSTSTPDSRDIWNEPWGKRLLDLQKELKERKIPSERVFMYSKDRPATQADVDIMKMHKDSKVEVYVYTATSPAAGDYYGIEKMEQDWIMIDDGRAIGVTRSLDPAGYRAYWYFNDDNKTTQYTDWRRILRNRSERLDEWLPRKHVTS